MACKTMANYEKEWQNALGYLELLISRANFTTWFKNTFILEADEQNIIIATPNAFTKVWLEKKYHEHIVKALGDAFSKQNLQVIYKVYTSQNMANISEKILEASVPELRNPYLGYGMNGLNHLAESN